MEARPRAGPAPFSAPAQSHILNIADNGDGTYAVTWDRNVTALTPIGDPIPGLELLNQDPTYVTALLNSGSGTTIWQINDPNADFGDSAWRITAAATFITPAPLIPQAGDIG